ncbi:MAG: hypothetical protein ACPGTG_00795 [Flavobacteriales bacterium]
MRKTLILSFLLLLSCSFLHQLRAQTETINHIEFELNVGWKKHDVKTFESGIISFAKRSKNWKIDAYSTNLELKKSIELKPKFKKLAKTYTDETHLYMLFTNNIGRYFELYIINAETLLFQKVRGDFPYLGKIWEFKVFKNTGFIKGNDVICSIDIKTGETKKLDTSIDGFTSQYYYWHKDIQIIDEANEVLIYVQTEMLNENEFFIIKFDENGERKEQIELDKTEGKNIISATSTYLNENSYIVTGTYSHNKKHASTGVYISKIINGETAFIKFYNFLDFDYFTKYLPQGKKRKIEKKQIQKDKKGKELEKGYLIEIHDIIKHNNQYFFLGEVFHSTQTTAASISTNRGLGVQSIFDGYQYTHAVLASFDENGNKQWDETCKLNPPFKPFSPRKFVTPSITDEGKIKLIYAGLSHIDSKTFSADGNFSGSETHKRIDKGDDEVDTNSKILADMDYWYNNYFIAHGTAKIRNKENGETRKVYFINKISYN